MDYVRIGITQYATKTAGISGKIKQEPEDFIVQEILSDGTVCSLEPNAQCLTPNAQSEYVQFTLVKKDWNQDTILKRLAQFCGVSKKRFTYAGTKDKVALTAQRISAWRIPPEKLAEFRIADAKLGDFEYSDKKLELGGLWGNQFTIRMTGVEDPEKTAEACSKIFKEIEKLGGLPNFFGEQRFGMHYNNHIVGRFLLQGKVEDAIKEFLTTTTEEDGDESRQKRAELAQKWGNFKEVGQFPAFLRFENALINHLIQHPKDFVGAFKRLSKNTYKFFTHSYQSYVFNLMLSKRLEVVSGKLEDEGNLVGYDSELSEEELKLLEKDGLKQENLRIKQFPEASVRGNKRKWLAEIKNWSCEPGENSVTLKFDLEKGAYATILLREILKN